MINELGKKVHENAKNKGFFDDEKNIGEMLCLIHSEVSEALEADRKNIFTPKGLNRLSIESISAVNEYKDSHHFKTSFSNNIKDTFEDELADIMIRVMDLATFKDIDLEQHIKAKMRYNSMRKHKHGKKY